MNTQRGQPADHAGQDGGAWPTRRPQMVSVPARTEAVAEPAAHLPGTPDRGSRRPRRPAPARYWKDAELLLQRLAGGRAGDVHAVDVGDEVHHAQQDQHVGAGASAGTGETFGVFSRIRSSVRRLCEPAPWRHPARPARPSPPQPRPGGAAPRRQMQPHLHAGQRAHQHQVVEVAQMADAEHLSLDASPARRPATCRTGRLMHQLRAACRASCPSGISTAVRMSEYSLRLLAQDCPAPRRAPRRGRRRAWRAWRA